jgi:hypothetical protein
MNSILTDVQCKYCNTIINAEDRARLGRICKRCSHYWKKYKIRTNDYNNLLESQNGSCAICSKTDPGTKTKTFCVDHCHSTGIVRGLLCINCNTGVGSLKESEEIFNNALLYLRNANTGTN